MDAGPGMAFRDGVPASSAKVGKEVEQQYGHAGADAFSRVNNNKQEGTYGTSSSGGVQYNQTDAKQVTEVNIATRAGDAAHPTPAGPAPAAGDKPPAGPAPAAGDKPPAGPAPAAGDKPPAGTAPAAPAGSGARDGVPTLNAANSVTVSTLTTEAAGHGDSFHGTNLANHATVEQPQSLPTAQGQAIVAWGTAVANAPAGPWRDAALKGLNDNLPAGDKLGPDSVVRVDGRIAAATGGATGATDGSRGTILSANNVHQVNVVNQAPPLGQDAFPGVHDVARTVTIRGG